MTQLLKVVKATNVAKKLKEFGRMYSTTCKIEEKHQDLIGGNESGLSMGDFGLILPS